MEILPTDHAEFSSKQYWEKFFQLRGQESFEWYGKFSEVYPTIRSHLSSSSEVLMIGCGNSNFSSDLYDAGVQSIVNIDFSDLVIQEMMIKNISRPKMRWDVGDMTDLSGFSNDSFDAVIDKGALDALVSTPSPELFAQAERMFSEIQRVLRVNGVYICISLAEPYVLHTLAKFFVDRSGVFECDWEVDVKRVESSDQHSPFIPFLFVIRKVNASETIRKPRLYVDFLGNSVSTHQTVDEHALEDTVRHLQQFQELRFKLNTLDMGRFETIPLWSDAHPGIPRFTIYVLDVSQSASLACAVFFVPSGRESDFQFTTMEGLTDIAFQAHCRRLIAVACNRPHVFPEMAGLQAELSPVMLALSSIDKDTNQQIPYLAVGSEPEWETISQGTSSVSGQYIIEEREDDDDARGQAVFRRLVFLQNQSLVQSEVRLVPAASTPASSGNKKKDKKKAKKAASSASAASSGPESYRLDPWHVDPLYRAMLASLCLRSRESELPRRAAVIGLGGGGLVMALQRFLPAGVVVDAVELDATVASLALSYFGFQPSAQTTVHVEDGVQFIANAAERLASAGAELRYDLVVIDVDSKDLSTGMSAPPRSFLTSQVLQHIWTKLLAPNGMLQFNVVARSKTRMQELVAQLNIELSESALYHLRASEDTVNIVLSVVKTPATSTPAPAASATKKGKGSGKAPPVRAQWHEKLRSWIQAVPNMQQDRLQLEGFVDKIEEVKM